MTAAERHKIGLPLEVLLIFLRLGVTSFGGPIVPSAIALIAFAFGADALRNPASLGLLHGLKLIAVAVVAQAVWVWRAPCALTASALRSPPLRL
jgi:chromate transporter